MTFIQEKQKEAREIIRKNGAHLGYANNILSEIDTLIATTIQDTIEKVQGDLKEVFLQDDGEDSYIALTARIALFIRTLTHLSEDV